MNCMTFTMGNNGIYQQHHVEFREPGLAVPAYLFAEELTLSFVGPDQVPLVGCVLGGDLDIPAGVERGIVIDGTLVTAQAHIVVTVTREQGGVWARAILLDGQSEKIILSKQVDAPRDIIQNNILTNTLSEIVNTVEDMYL